MTPQGILNIVGAIVTVGLVTTIVAHPGSADTFRAVGSSFSQALATAMGNR